MLTSLVLCLVATSLAFAADDKIMIDVYYESLCPDSQKFIKDQLFPTWENPQLQNMLEINLVPYGKATTRGTAPNYEFECQHGEPECVGNRYHACGIKKISDPKMSIPYVNCLMKNTVVSNPHFESANKMCVNELKLSDDLVESIKQCSLSLDGLKFLAEYGNMTDKFEQPLKSVPSVRFNNETMANANAAKDFKSSVCDLIKTNKPATCAEKNDASALSVLSVFPLVFAVIATRL